MVHKKRKIKRIKTRKLVLQKQLKAFDLNAGISISPVFNIYHLNPVAASTDYNGRIGLQLKGNSLDFKATFTFNTATLGSSSCAIRYIIFTDLQQRDSTSPGGYDILSLNTVVSSYNLFNIKRFHIHKDVQFNLDNYHLVRQEKFKVPVNHLVRYSGSSGSTITKNGLYMLLLSSNITNVPSVEFWVRYNYTDF